MELEDCPNLDDAIDRIREKNPNWNDKKVARAIRRIPSYQKRENRELIDYIEARDENIKSEKRKSRLKKTGLSLLASATVLTALVAGYFVTRTNEPPKDYKPSPVVKSISTIPEDTKPRKKISLEDIASIPGVKNVHSSNANYPEAIVILQNHPHLHREFEDIHLIPNAKAKRDISLSLYDLGARGLLLEGTSQGGCDDYNKNGFLKIANSPSSKLSEEWTEITKEITDSRKWRLYPGYFEDIDQKVKIIYAPIADVHKRYAFRIRSEWESEINKRGHFDTDTKRFIMPDMKVLKPYMSKRLHEIRDEMQPEIDAYFTKEVNDKLYSIVVTEREKRWARLIKISKIEGQTPTVVHIGTAHCRSFQNLLEAEGIPYAMVIPDHTPDDIDFNILRKDMGPSYSLRGGKFENWTITGTITKDGKFKLK